MYGFIKRFANGVFFPDEVQILVGAFNEAWAKLQSSHAICRRSLRSGRTGSSREAHHHGGSERRGERNPRRLTDDALLYLSRQRLSKKPPA
jgi:hypothetical protein